MKRRFLKKGIAALMCLVMSLGSLQMVSAEEYDNTDYEEDYWSEDVYSDDAYESIPEISDTDTDGDGTADAIQPVNNDASSAYSLVVSKQKVSFGNVSLGKPIKSQPISIANTGSRAVNLIWKDVDPDCAFLADVTQAQTIAPGQSAIIYIAVATNKDPGAYSGVLLFADAADPSYTSGVRVETSVTIIDDQPVIKRLTVTPGQTTIAPGGSMNFYTEVEGEGNYDDTVKYSVTGNKSTDTKIDANGRLTVGKNETASGIFVVATSNQDSSKHSDAKVEIKASSHTVNVYSSPSKGGDVTGGGAYADGSKVVLKAYASNGWSFSGWSIDDGDVGGGSSYTIDKLTSDVTAVAIFERESVRIKAEPNHKHMGSVTGDGYYDMGDDAVLKAEAKSGYKFSCWMEGKKKISSDSKLKLKDVDEDRSLTAVFVKTKCVISVATCDETMGSVSGGKTVDMETDVTVKASPKKGYKFVKWLCNDQQVSTSAEYTLKKLKDDVSLVAIFAPETTTKKVYTVTSATTDKNGIISPSGSIQIEEGKGINYAITPKSGYRIAAIAIDGKQVSPTSSFTLSNIGSDHTIVVAFLPIQKQSSAAVNTQSAASVQTAATATATQTVGATEKTTKGNTAAQPQIVSAAKDSDLNKEVKAESKKTYEENVVTVDNLKLDEDSEGTSSSMNNDMDELEGVLQIENITELEASDMLADEQKKFQLMEEAVAEEVLEVNVDNTMRTNKFVMTYDDETLDDPERENFAKILCGAFSDNEVMRLLSGEDKVYVDVAISGVQEKFVAQEDKDEIKQAIPEDKRVGKYFFSSFIKSVDGVSTEITEFAAPLMVRVDVPDSIYEEGRSYSIARLHTDGNGNREVTILEDEDDDPETVTFYTDRFSTYAILCDADIQDKNLTEASVQTTAEGSGASSGMAVIFVAAAVILLAVVAIVLALVLKKSKKKHKRH